MSTSNKRPASAAAVADAKPPEASPQLTRQEHIARHKMLHEAVDELFADFIRHHPRHHGFLEMPVYELMKWSCQQMTDPDEETP